MEDKTTPSAAPGTVFTTRHETAATPHGEFSVTFPARLTHESLHAFDQWLGAIFKREQRQLEEATGVPYTRDATGGKAAARPRTKPVSQLRQLLVDTGLLPPEDATYKGDDGCDCPACRLQRGLKEFNANQQAKKEAEKS